VRTLAYLALLLAVFAALAPLLISARSRFAGHGARIVIPWRVRLRIALAGGDLGLMFFRRGKSSARLVLTCADPAAPTVAELDAGTDLSKAVAAIAGFETTLNRINQPVMAYAEELQIDGPQTFADASMTLLEDDGTGADGDSTARQAAYTALDEGSAGFMVLAPSKAGALIAADDVELWPYKVGARNRGWSLDAEAARYTVQFAITGSPQKDATVTA
jgi:hypothetical protein